MIGAANADGQWYVRYFAVEKRLFNWQDTPIPSTGSRFLVPLHGGLAKLSGTGVTDLREGLDGRCAPIICLAEGQCATSTTIYDGAARRRAANCLNENQMGSPVPIVE